MYQGKCQSCDSYGEVDDLMLCDSCGDKLEKEDFGRNGYITIHKVGAEIYRNSKQGGGSYTVIGHINCDRCETLIEEREITSPTKKHWKRGRYYSQYSWCHKCGLYAPDLKSKEIIL